jgi:hypothetical protein
MAEKKSTPAAKKKAAPAAKKKVAAGATKKAAPAAKKKTVAAEPKKTAAKKPAAARSKRSSASNVSEDMRLHMIREAAYYRAQHRGFGGGAEAEDWYAAEREIDVMLGRLIR